MKRANGPFAKVGTVGKNPGGERHVRRARGGGRFEGGTFPCARALAAWESAFGNSQTLGALGLLCSAAPTLWAILALCAWVGKFHGPAISLILGPMPKFFIYLFIFYFILESAFITRSMYLSTKTRAKGIHPPIW
jgi:hypothetical protein